MQTNIKIFGTLVAVAFLLIVGIVLRYTQAADVATTAEIENEAPTVDTVRFSTTAYGADDLTSSGILPNVGTTRTIHINGVVSDANGENDINTSSIALIFHRTSKGSGCSADSNDCYIVTTTCTTDVNHGADTEVAYDCPIDITYFIDATDAPSIFADDTWTAYVIAEDAAQLSGEREATIEVLSLLALNLPDAIDYGTRSLGEVSSSTTNIETILTQRGNTKADVEVLGTSMSCDQLGTLATSSQAWALTDVGHSTSTILTDSFVATERNINLRTDDNNELSANLYWNISIPATGVKGICTGSNTIAIVAQVNEEASLVDGRLQNVRFTADGRTGFTASTGNFIIQEGEIYTFYIGAISLGSIAYEDIPQDRLIFLQDLLGLARTNTTDSGLVKLAQFLQSLATETNLTGSTVLAIPEAAHTVFTRNISLDLDDAALQVEIQKVHAGRTIRSAAQATEHMNETLAYEGVLNSYTVSVSQGANTTITPSSRTVVHGNTTSFTVTPASGYSVAASGCGGVLTGTTYTTDIITGDCTITTSATALFTCGVDTVQYSGGPYNAAGTTKDQGGYYRTVSIGTQCWMKDNLNAGTMLASGAATPSNNGTIEKWCYSNSTTNCNNEGGLYQWNEAMQYSTTGGAQGICPSGYHIPTDTEWKTLEIFLGMTQAQADQTSVWRGTDQGTKLKAGGASGMEILLPGYRLANGTFVDKDAATNLWSSTQDGTFAWRRLLFVNPTTVFRNSDAKTLGFSVRCLKD